MKVHLYGNNANMAFNFCRFLRRLNIDAYIYADRFPLVKSDLPQWEYPDAERYDWLRYVNVSVKGFLAFRRNERDFLKELKKCDIIHSFGEASQLVRFASKPYLHWTYGYDLDNIPFKGGSLKHLLLANLQRAALKKAGLLIYSMPHQRESVSKLRLSNALYFPLIPIDTDIYNKIDEESRKKIRSEYDCDFLFAHLARQEWVRNEPGQQNKRNDKLFRAFARFIKDTGKKAVMLVADKGRDVLESKRLISELGIDKNIVWILPRPKYELIKLLSAVDAVFDQFGAGSAGLLVLECMSMGIPTFIYFSPEYEASFKEPPPVINVFTEEEIYNKITKLCENADMRVKTGISARNWVIKYFHWELVTKQFIKFYENILNKSIT